MYGMMMLWIAGAVGLTALDFKYLRKRRSIAEWSVYVALMSGSLVLIGLILFNKIHFSLIEMYIQIYSPVGNWLTKQFTA